LLVEDAMIKRKLSENVMCGIGNQYRVLDCSLLAVFLSDFEPTSRIQRVYQLEKQWRQTQIKPRSGRHPSYLSTMPLVTSFLLGQGTVATALKQSTMNIMSRIAPDPMPSIDGIEAWGCKNTALVVQSYVLAATSFDLATSIMEGYDTRRMRELLRIPDRYGVPMVVATGYEYHEEREADQYEKSGTRRLGLNELVFCNTFGNTYEPPSDIE
jgi:nitroreductase